MKYLKYFLPSIVILGIFAVAGIALANPFFVGSKAKSATATSTLVYMTPGTATTTVTYDSYEVNGTNQPNSGNNTLPNVVAFLLQGAASSTATVVNATCEFGNDEANSAGVVSTDWYQNDITLASTTPGQINIAPINSFSFTYASTTVGGAAPLNTNRFQKLVTCPVPTRYVRLVVSITGANAGVWVGVVPTKQRN